MYKNFLFIFIFILTGANISYCQEDLNIYVPSVSTSAPSSFVFATYGNIGMDNSSGAFNHTIPLYTLEYRDINLPITISYLSNGVKVDELSSQVGTGWVFNAGGIVSRVMRGFPDEKTRWYPEILDKTQNETRRNILALGTGRTRIDTEQDWFSFNINGISGSFYFDENMNIHVNSKEYVAITYIKENGNITSFMLTDNNGYRYMLGGSDEFIEETTTENVTEEIPRMLSYNSSWFLKEIISPTSNKMKFEYVENPIPYDISGLSEFLVFTQPENIRAQFKYGTSCFIQTYTTKAKLLSRIYFEDNDNSIVLGYSHDRSDRGGLLLKNISVKKGSEIIRKINFAYNSVRCTGELSARLNILPYNHEYLFNRLFLESITFADKGEAVSEKYGFEYYDSVDLPGRFTYSKDKYGYPGYNNTSSFSEKAFEVVKLYNFPTASEFLCTANLEVNPDRVFTGMLKKIIYPTGGFTTVKYEANSTFMPVAKVKDENFTVSLVTNCLNIRDKTSKSFVITENFKNSTMAVRLTGAYLPNDCPRADGGSFAFRIWNKRTNEVLFTGEQHYSWTTAPTTGYADINIPHATNRIGDSIVVEITAYDPMVSCRANIRCSWQTNYIEDDIVYAGGARVKEILSSTGEQNIKKTYYYNKLSEYPSDKSSISVKSGLQEIIPDYVRTSKYLIWKPTTGGFGYFIERLRIYVSPYPPGYLHDNRSGLIHYETITEITDNNGAVERTYKTPNNTRGTVVNGPRPFGVPPLSNKDDAIRGLLETEKTFKKNASGYTLARKKDYTYEKLYEKRLKSHIMSCMDMSVYINENIENISIVEYDNYIQVYKLAQVTDSIFNTNGSIGNRKISEYGISPYYHLKKQTDILSPQDIRVSGYQYPYELSGQLSEMDKLISTGRIGIPIIVEKRKEAPDGTRKILSSVKAEYGLFTGNQLVLPASISEKTENNSFYQQIVFDRYDEKGNLLQYTAADGVPVSYLWSYNGQYLVAEIKNATYDRVAALIDTQTLSDKSALGESDIRLLDGLRTSLPSAMVTTYTYKPLTGMESATDPSGMTSYYEYDNFNRLKRIYIKENGIEKNIESYEYNYRNQQP